MSQRYYDILGVNKDASLMEMKEAYERLCKEYEPSDHQFDPEYVKRYEEVQEAFDWLKNNHMWTINVEEESNDETAPPKQPDKQEKLIDLRYVLLAVVILSSAICYLFVSPYLGSGSSKNVVVSNNEQKGVESKLNEDALNDSYSLFKSDGYTGSLEDYVELLESNKEALLYSYELFKDAGYAKSIEDFSVLIGLNQQQEQTINEQLLKDYVATANNPDYNGNWDLINSKFPEFFAGVKKKDQPQEDMVSSSEDGSSDLSDIPEFDPSTFSFDPTAPGAPQDTREDGYVSPMSTQNMGMYPEQNVLERA